MLEVESKGISMTKENWERVSSRVKAVFNFGIEKSDWLENCRMARLIAAVPFLAGCNKAEETSFTNLVIYVLSIDESSKEIYFHKPGDDTDLYSRLAPINNFLGGDQKIIQCCMDLIALNMIAGYKRDMKEDESIGKYNPLNIGNWDYDTMSEKLVQDINAVITSEISSIYTMEDALRGLWRI